MVKLKRFIRRENFILESIKDFDDLKEHLGDTLFNDYMKIRDRISDSEWRNLEILKKKDPEEIKDFINNFQSKTDKKKQDKSKGSEKLYEDDGWLVLRITSYPAAQKYGSGTKWCITGRYSGHEERGEEYFNNYIRDNNLDGGYYFFINKKDNSEKYCVLLTDKHHIVSIWNAEDSELRDVDPYDISPDLIEFRNKLSFGNELADYVEKYAGEYFDAGDSLINELAKRNCDVDKIVHLAEILKEEGTEDFSDYFNNALYSNSFKALLNVVIPPENHLEKLETLGMSLLVEDFMKNTKWWCENVSSSYFNTLFKTLVENKDSYSKILYYKQKDFWNQLLKECDSDLSKNLSFYSIYNSLGKIVSDKEFLKLLLDNGFSIEEILDALYFEDDFIEDLIKNLVSLHQLDFNKKFSTGSKNTYFSQILLDLDPSLEFVKWMLAQGADPFIKDVDGDDSIAYTENEKIIDFLKHLK